MEALRTFGGGVENQPRARTGREPGSGASVISKSLIANTDWIRVATSARSLRWPRRVPCTSRSRRDSTQNLPCAAK